MRLSHHLRDLGLGNGEIRQALKNGKVTIRGVPTSDGGRDIDPEHVAYRADAPRITPGRDIAIVHKDDDMVVIWKPAGLLSVPAGKEGGHLNVVGAVRRLLGAAHVVHRIDEQTSGLMMVARTEKARLHLKEQLFEHSIERRYLALVHGQPRHETWETESLLVRDRGDGLRGSRPEGSEEEGKNSRTSFRTLAKVGRFASLVEAQLDTGRTHQVRIHLAEAKHPVLGDPLYAHKRAQRAARRLCLHAAVLSFDQPSTGERIRLEAPLADDMEQLRRSLLTEETQRNEKSKSRSSKKNTTKKKKRSKKSGTKKRR